MLRLQQSPNGFQSPRLDERRQLAQTVGQIITLVIESKELGSELKRAKENSEAATQAKSEFLANMNQYLLMVNGKPMGIKKNLFIKYRL